MLNVFIRNSLDLVDEMMKANRIDPETHPIMHEYFANKEYHKIWMFNRR